MPRAIAQDFKASLILNGSSSKAKIGAAVGVSLINPYSVEFWFKAPSQLTDLCLFSSGNTGSNNQFFRIVTDGQPTNRIRVNFKNDAATNVLTSTSSVGSYFDNQWHHLVWTDTPGAGKLYVDGKLDSNMNYTPSGVFTANQTGVGGLFRATDTGFVFGFIANLRIYNSVLSPADIATRYQGGAVSATPLLAWWLQEGAGTTAIDTSGSGNNGTITSGIWSTDTPSKLRQQVGGNLITNGSFEYAPPFTAATTNGSKWVDGTTTGSTTNTLFNWAFVGDAGSGSAQFDTASPHSGTYCMKVTAADATSKTRVILGSIITGGSLTAAQLANTTRIKPSTVYSLTYWIKSDSGTAGTVGLTYQTYNGAGTRNLNTASATAITGTTSWTQVTDTFTTGASDYYFLLQFGNSANSVMTAYIDDISLTESVPVPRSTAQDFKASLSFNGTSSVVTATSPLRTAGQPFSWGSKFKVASGNTGTISGARTGNGAGNIYKFGVDTTGNLSFNYDPIGGGIGVVTTKLVRDGQWHTAVGTYDGSTISCYVDGALVYSIGSKTTAAINVTSFAIGKRADLSLEYFSGNISSTFISTNAFTAQEAANWHASGILPASYSYSGIWQLQEGAGTSALDTSGNANNGTITAGTWSADVPSRKRQVVGASIVNNSDFEFIPPGVTPNTASGGASTWVDNTGVTSTNPLFGWNLAANNTAAASALIDTTTSHSGTASMKLVVTTGHANGAGLQQYGGNTRSLANFSILPNLLPNTSYTLSGWVKTTSVTSVNGASAGAVIRVLEGTASGYGGVSNNSAFTTGTTGWTQQSITFTTAATTRKAEVGLYIINESGTAWFDDIVLTPTTNTTRSLAA